MSFITNEDIEIAEQKYGKPIELETQVIAVPKELESIRKSQKDGRSHDVTLFIFKDDQLLFIAKHFYPKDLYRAPSGAAKPGESIIEGGIREACEETGAIVEIEKYLLRIKVRFVSGDDFIDWTSYIFKAKYISGEIKPIDTREIREARFVNVSDIPRFNEIMRKINMAGFRYRVFLTENTMKLLDNDAVRRNEA